MYQRHITGITGEDVAYEYLKDNGYVILERNFSCRQGELDIIAHDLNTSELVVIEVKTRTNSKFGKPAEAVDFKKQFHILNSARYYTYIKHLENVNTRIDVIEIYIKNNKYCINHIKNAIN